MHALLAMIPITTSIRHLSAKKALPQLMRPHHDVWRAPFAENQMPSPPLRYSFACKHCGHASCHNFELVLDDGFWVMLLLCLLCLVATLLRTPHDMIT